MTRVAATMAIMKKASPCHQVLGVSEFWTAASDMIFPSKILWRKYRTALLGLSMAGRALMASEPPITDSIRVSAAVLLKGETAPAPFFSGDWAKALSKGMPTSIALYLKPSSVIDSRNLAVKKAAAQALKLLGPAAPKAALD